MYQTCTGFNGWLEFTVYGTNLRSCFRATTEQCNKPEDLCPYETKLLHNYNTTAYSIITFHINCSCGDQPACVWMNAQESR